MRTATPAPFRVEDLEARVAVLREQRDGLEVDVARAREALRGYRYRSWAQFGLGVLVAMGSTGLLGLAVPWKHPRPPLRPIMNTPQSIAAPPPSLLPVVPTVMLEPLPTDAGPTPHPR